MGLLEKIKALFAGKKAPDKAAEVLPAEAQGTKQKKTCKKCGKMFTYDTTWEFIPNYCKECKKQFAQEKEEKQRAGAPRRIRRKCKACGRFFTFPNTIAHYPNYCPNCRKQHQAAMKEKYAGKGGKQGSKGK